MNDYEKLKLNKEVGRAQIMSDSTKTEAQKECDERPFSEYCQMANQYWENELMRGQRMYAPPLPPYKPEKKDE